MKLLVWEAGTVWVQSDQCSEHLGWCVSTLDGNALWFISPSCSVCVCVCVCVCPCSVIQSHPTLCDPVDPIQASQVALVVNNLPASAGDVRDAGLIPRSGRSPGGGHGNLLQYSCLENPMDRGAWWGTVHRVVKSET